MDFSIYFDTIHYKNASFPNGTIGESIFLYDSGVDDSEINKYDMAVIGVKDDRRAMNNKGCAEAPDAIRKHLYSLYLGTEPFKVIDMGNIKKGNTVEDTYFALSNIISELIKKNVVPIIIGGGQDLTYANYMAYQQLEQIVNIVSVDCRLNLGEADEEIHSQSFLSKIILKQPNFLFNYSNIGYQTYFVNKKELELMSKLYFDVHRLGEVALNIQEVEPIIRDADILSFDVSAIRQSDAAGNSNSTPNGFYGEDACQITRYAGLSDKLTSIGFYEMNPLFDKEGHTAHLVAQMIWYFIEGFYSRKKDFPLKEKKGFTKYRVSIQENKHEIIFYKSIKSDRWWMEVPYPDSKKIKYARHHLVPCSYNDYQIACQEDMPDRWWKAYQKLS